MNKKATSMALAAALVLVMGVGFFGHALADNGSDQGNSGDSGSGVGIGSSVSALAHAINGGQDGAEAESGGNSTQESLSVSSSGSFTITGAKVVSVNTSANTITGTLYGITKTVSVADATITGGGANIALSSIQSGDQLSVKGTFNESTQTATITSINDVSYAAQNTANVQSRISQLLQLVQQLQAQLQVMQHASSSSN